MGRNKSLKQVLYLLRLLENNQHTPLSKQDAILVSIDLEVSRAERAAMLANQSYMPLIDEVGIAILDLGIIFDPSTAEPRSLLHQIDIRQYSTHHASEDFEDCDFTDFQECVFARTEHIRQVNIVSTIERCLQHPAHTNPTRPFYPGSGQLRPVLLVGHSIKYDMNVLERLGLDITRSGSVIGILDSHSLSRHILPSGPYSLGAVLSQVGCAHSAHDLHNAGNDATYTLLAVLLLSAMWADKQNPNETQADHQRLIRTFVKLVVEAPRWRPIRMALGAHKQAPSVSEGSPRTEPGPWT